MYVSICNYSNKQILCMCYRGAIECIRAVCVVEPGQILCPEATQTLETHCDKLQKCAHDLTQLKFLEHAAEALIESSHGLR